MFSKIFSTNIFMVRTSQNTAAKAAAQKGPVSGCITDTGPLVAVIQVTELHV